MHSIQQQIMDLSQTEDVFLIGLRPLARRLNIKNPQVVKHHLLQLQKKGLLQPRSRGDIQQILNHTATLQPSFIDVPVVGMANCGIPTMIADEHIAESIRLSESLLKKRGNIFAVVARGDSMNNARVPGGSIENDDYVIIDGDQRSPISGDYVLSIIDNCANIKKYMRTNDGHIALISESTAKHPPIYISPDDEFFVNGKVIQVVKNIKEN